MEYNLTCGLYWQEYGKFTSKYNKKWAINNRVSSTGFLEIDLVPNLKIDEFWYDLLNSVKKIQCLLYENKI